MSSAETRNANASSRPLVQLSNVTKSYGAGSAAISALDDVSLDVMQGEFVSIQGPSGCGKSTLLSVLGLLESADGGKYLLSGTHVDALTFDQKSAVRNRYIGLVFQSFNLISNMSVLQNVLLPLKYNKDVVAASRVEVAHGFLKRVGMDNRADAFPGELSGGQQQRVAIARALVTGPALLLADEPTGNLDSRNAASVVDLLQQLNDEGMTIMLVTHAPEFAERASRTLHLLDGKFV